MSCSLPNKVHGFKILKKILGFFFIFFGFSRFFWVDNFSHFLKQTATTTSSHVIPHFFSNSKFDERINIMPSDEVTCSKGGSEQVVGSGRLIELGPQGGGRWRRSLGGGRSFGREADEGRRWRRGQSAARTRRESDAEGQQRRKGRRWRRLFHFDRIGRRSIVTRCLHWLRFLSFWSLKFKFNLVRRDMLHAT